MEAGNRQEAWHRHMGFEECGFITGINDGVGELFLRKALGKGG